MAVKVLFCSLFHRHTLAMHEGLADVIKAVLVGLGCLVLAHEHVGVGLLGHLDGPNKVASVRPFFRQNIPKVWIVEFLFVKGLESYPRCRVDNVLHPLAVIPEVVVPHERCRFLRVSYTTAEVVLGVSCGLLVCLGGAVRPGLDLGVRVDRGEGALELGHNRSV